MPDLPEFPFKFEFYNETNLPDAEYYEMAYDQITDLAEGHTDLVGASVTLKELSSEETPNAYESIVTLNVRPTNISAREVADSALTSLQQSLEAAIQQVRDQREQLKGHM